MAVHLLQAEEGWLEVTVSIARERLFDLTGE